MKNAWILLLGLVLAGGLVACSGSSEGGDTKGAADAVVVDSDTGVPKSDTSVPTDTKPETVVDHGGVDNPPPDVNVIDNPPPEVVKDTATDQQVQNEGTTQPEVKPETQQETSETGPDVTYGSCKWFYECANECPPPPNDQACIQDCQKETTPEGWQQAMDFEQCMQQNGCFDLTDQDARVKCLTDHCIQQYFKCFQGNIYTTCKDFWLCADACPDPKTDPQGADACIGNCWDGATYDALMDNWAVGQCISKNCPICDKKDPTPAEDQQCIDCQNQYLGPGGDCRDEYEKCAPSGNKHCGDVFQCINQCAADTSCAQGCYKEGTFKAQELVLAVFDCMEQACKQFENDDQAWQKCANDALTGACKSQVDACEADA